MRISYNWLKDYIKLDKTAEEVSSILTDIGLEVEHVDRVPEIEGNLEGLVVGAVVACEPHPNADRLKETLVDIGQAEPLHIVCGAPNVRQGQKVLVATVGTTLYPNQGGPFKIKKSKIRGALSEGMLCAEDEVGLGEGHEGIMVLDDAATPGQTAADYFNLQDTIVFEIGLTPNRSDAMSHFGVARDLAAFLRSETIFPKIWDAPDSGQANPVQVLVKDPELCPRYTSVVIENVTVKASPDWLVDRIQSIGLRPINNVVDITNYVMHELGQPLHAFDADKITGQTIIVGAGMQGSFTTLDNVERTLDKTDLMISDKSGGLCVAGVMGGLNSGVSEGTCRVFLESAYFDPVSVRKTSKRHGLKSDSSFRFERGVDPNMTERALRRAVYLIQELAGGTVRSAISDFYPQKIEAHKLEVDCERIEALIGQEIGRSEIVSILRALDIRVIDEGNNLLGIEVPAYRHDVRREVDVAEEILRIYGYNNIEFSQQIRSSVNISEKPDPEVTQQIVADFLVANGFYEILNNSLTKPTCLDNPDNAVRILNPLSNDLAVMRQTLLYSGLETISYNQKRKQNRLALFEFGKVYSNVSGEFRESRRLGIFMNGSNVPVHWKNKPHTYTFFDLKGIIKSVLSRIGIQDPDIKEVEGSAFDFGLAFYKSDTCIATFGQVCAEALKLSDAAGPVFYAELHWDHMLKLVKKNKLVYQEVPRFPAVKRDLSLLVNENISFERLREIAIKTDRKLLRNVDIFDVYKGKNLPVGKKSYALSFIFQDESKTLKDKQIDSAVQKLITNFEKEAGAEVRK